MKKYLKLVAAMALVAGVAQAAGTTSGTTVSVAVNPYMGSAPVTAYISGTVTSVNSPQIAMPNTSKTLNAVACMVRDINDNTVPRKVYVSGENLIIATAVSQVSGTLTVGDKVNCVLSYQR